MLIELFAENIAIMDHAEVSFGPGFTSITGETGAGKSLLIDAISLCLGERADISLVRSGATSATVRAVFDAPTETRELLEALGYGIGDEALYLQRDLAAEGKSTCRINGRTAPVNVLKQIGDTLADLHGQHEHQSLLHVANHLGMLDSWVGPPAHDARSETQAAWDELSRLKRERESLSKDASERERLIDVLRFQVDEIEAAGVSIGEIEQLQNYLKRLQGAESLQSLINNASNSLFRDETNARGLLQGAIHSLEEAATIDDELATATERLRRAELSVEEVVDDIKAAAERVEFDAEKIEATAARLDLYATLRRKYGKDETEILRFLDDATRDLDRLENAEHASSQLEERIQAAQEKYNGAAKQLSTIRTKAAGKLASGVQSEVQELGMPAGKFASQIVDKTPSRDGTDAFEFLFSANAGENVKPLSKIASGGEMSRVMLAIKTVMAGRGGVPTLIFDEIDAGLGGQTAAVVAKKLSKLGENYQVLAITHVPQIAGKAAAQVSIEKTTDRNRTITIVKQLSPDDRVQEIARMVAGESVTDEAIANAKQLLAD
ncbi:MAG: DNA repair protein RecN [Fimbriimonadales bacterium]